jgi:hypothetical protein
MVRIFEAISCHPQLALSILDESHILARVGHDEIPVSLAISPYIPQPGLFRAFLEVQKRQTQHKKNYNMIAHLLTQDYSQEPISVKLKVLFYILYAIRLTHSHKNLIPCNFYCRVLG